MIGVRPVLVGRAGHHTAPGRSKPAPCRAQAAGGAGKKKAGRVPGFLERWPGVWPGPALISSPASWSG